MGHLCFFVSCVSHAFESVHCHRSLTLIFFLSLYTLYVVKGRMVTPLLHKLYLGELHRYYSGYNLVPIPFE